MYLECGGMEEIQRMSYWDFWGIVKSLILRAKRQNGETIYKEMKPSQKKMMEDRIKQQEKRKKGKQHGRKDN